LGLFVKLSGEYGYLRDLRSRSSFPVDQPWNIEIISTTGNSQAKRKFP
jgi:hypothetical protein